MLGATDMVKPASNILLRANNILLRILKPTSQNLRRKLHAAFRKQFPQLNDTEQRNTAQRRAIIVNSLLQKHRFDEIKVEIAALLQQATTGDEKNKKSKT
jgi:uncharacterized protein (DUF1697 family)